MYTNTGIREKKKQIMSSKLKEVQFQQVELEREGELAGWRKKGKTVQGMAGRPKRLGLACYPKKSRTPLKQESDMIQTVFKLLWW